MIYLKRKIDSYLAERKIAAKFQISRISKDARFRDYRGCMKWLESAGLVNICYCLHSPELPLKGNYDETKYKIYFSDSGLLVPCWTMRSLPGIGYNISLALSSHDPLLIKTAIPED